MSGGGASRRCCSTRRSARRSTRSTPSRCCAACCNRPASRRETGPIDVLCRAVLAGEADEARRRWHAFLATLEKQPLLYVSLGRGGDPREIVAARGLQPMLRDLARACPSWACCAKPASCWKRPGTWKASHVFRRRSGERVRSAVRSRLQGAGRKPGRGFALLAGQPGRSRARARTGRRRPGRRPGAIDRIAAQAMAGPQPDAAAVGAGKNRRRKSLAGPGQIHRTLRPRSAACSGS